MFSYSKRGTSHGKAKGQENRGNRNYLSANLREESIQCIVKSKGKGRACVVAKIPLRYRVINPNSAEATIELLLTLLIEANRFKVEEALQSTVHRDKIATSHSA